MASLSPSYLIHVMSQFGVSILGVSLRHLDVAFLCVSLRFSAFLGVSRRFIASHGCGVSRRFSAFLGMSCVAAGRTPDTQVRFNSAFVLRWRRQRGRQRRRFVSTCRRASCDGEGNVDVSDAGSFQLGVRRSNDGGATSTSVTRY